MELEIDPRQSPPGVQLLEPEHLRSFAVVVVDEAAGEDRWPPAVAKREEHVWIRIDALRELARPLVGPDWEEGFTAMIDFAKSRGWVDEELGAVRGHVERRRPGGGS